MGCEVPRCLRLSLARKSLLTTRIPASLTPNYTAPTSTTNYFDFSSAVSHISPASPTTPAGPIATVTPMDPSRFGPNDSLPCGHQYGGQRCGDEAVGYSYSYHTTQHCSFHLQLHLQLHLHHSSTAHHQSTKTQNTKHKTHNGSLVTQSFISFFVRLFLPSFLRGVQMRTQVNGNVYIPHAVARRTLLYFTSCSQPSSPVQTGPFSPSMLCPLSPP